MLWGWGLWVIGFSEFLIWGFRYRFFGFRIRISGFRVREWDRNGNGYENGMGSEIGFWEHYPGVGADPGTCSGSGIASGNMFRERDWIRDRIREHVPGVGSGSGSIFFGSGSGSEIVY
ncbi:hypothetical protein NE237_014162 [Protea cynaroides]|uniref:Uncharacterized protein n=1 Tax=Protea cynaroides TaxID=273540 RepID=A0A9Q0GNT2_9MAGN|nr:hypothetical protein NE237_014162 [Protea cynaroides]